jgi:hypothetical protein
MKRILFITNGNGEDVVAKQIIEKIHSRSVKIDILPIVGDGHIFRGMNAEVIGPKVELPSGGFGLRNYSFLIKDLTSGLIPKTASQIKLLRKSRGKYSLVIGIGDIVPVFCGLLTCSPQILIGINKSEHYNKFAFNYTNFEKWLIKKYCRLLLTRDKKTEGSLKTSGINAKYVGNPMMDAVQNIRRSGHQKTGKIKAIGFLPGTREDAYKNIEDFYKIAWQIRKTDRNIKFLLSFPKSLDKRKYMKIKSLVAFELMDNFDEVLKGSDIIIGLSGTGNEQAAGSGLPIIVFPGRGAQFNYKFAVGQKELLGEAVMLLPRNSNVIAHEAQKLLSDTKSRNRMALAGKERMGGPGASAKMAGIILNGLGQKHKK